MVIKGNVDQFVLFAGTIQVDMLDKRLQQLELSLGSSAYEQQKSHLEQALVRFLSLLCPPKDMMSATPQDITRFLVFKDQGGKTQVHVMNCVYIGESGRQDCDCPVRLSAETVDSLIGKLRAIFNSNGRGGDWDVKLGFGNPAASPGVKRYLKGVREEQAKAMVKPQQAKPMFIDKLVRLSEHIRATLQRADLSPLQQYILARDQAYFKAQLFSGDRPGDLGMVKTQEIPRFPQDDGLLFNHQFGKTLRGGASNVFGIKRCGNITVCPVRGIEHYIAMADRLSIDLRNGYLFRPTDSQGYIYSIHHCRQTWLMHVSSTILLTWGSSRGRLHTAFVLGVQLLWL